MVGLYIPDLGYMPNKYFVHVHGLDSLFFFFCLQILILNGL